MNKNNSIKILGLISIFFLSNFASANQLYVGTNKQYKTIATAVAAAKSGDTIFLNAGTYTNESIIISKPLTIIGTGGTVHINGNKNIANGKAYMVTDADTTLQNLSFENAVVADKNGAGIRYELGNLTIKNCSFLNNQDGILSASNANGTIIIDNSIFSGNGTSLDGYTHGVYIGAIKSFTITNSKFYGTHVGHHIKSRALSTTIQNNILDDANANTSYDIDIPNGGKTLIIGNTITKGAKAQNQTIIEYGAEGMKYTNNSLTISGNTIKNLRSTSIGVSNYSKIYAVISNNIFYGVKTIASGLATLTNNTKK